MLPETTYKISDTIKSVLSELNETQIKDVIDSGRDLGFWLAARCNYVLDLVDLLEAQHSRDLNSYQDGVIRAHDKLEQENVYLHNRIAEYATVLHGLQDDMKEDIANGKSNTRSL